ncbi:MAG: hypothetical protein HY241_00600 [Actinobacteria bacterium]|nr:hypothetical protein [Actinomycetota bacterium]
MFLDELLSLAEWGPRQLVTAVNARLSSQGRDRLRLDPTAAYPWVRRGFRPRPPIPDVVAAVLTARLGFPVTAGQLWPGRDAVGQPTQSAAEGLATLTHVDDLVQALNHLTFSAATPRSSITEASGIDLTAVVLDQRHGAVFVARARAGHEQVLPEQVELIATHVAALRRLDDRHGGGALSLRYVTAELRSVADLVEHANYGSDVGRQLLTIVADLAQLLGWLHFDSGRYGSAERYLLLSIGMCRALGAADRAANAIGMLSYVSAFAGHGVQAVRIAQVATAECGGAEPVLRARLLGRLATAAAADGDLALFRRQSEEAATVLDEVRSDEAPSFLYYLAPAQLAAEAGQGLVVLAEHATAGRDRLLGEAITTLRGAVATLAAPGGDGGGGPAYPRSALLHTTFLARAHLLHGDLPEAVVVIRSGLDLLAQVQSPRVRSYLLELRPALVRRSRTKLVREFLPDFDEALSHV